MIEAWKAVLTKPEETMAAEKANANLVSGIKNIVIAAVIAGLVMGIGISVVSMLVAPMMAMVPGTGPVAGALAGFGLAAIIVTPIVLAILAVILTLIANLAMWIAAKIAGGQGTFSQQYYLLSLLPTPLVITLVVASIVLGILSIIPVVGAILALIIWAILEGYLAIIVVAAYIAAMKQVHGFDTAKVGLATGITIALVAIGLVALIVALLMPVLGGLMSMAGPMA